MCKKKEVKDYRTELEKQAEIRYFTMKDGTQVRVLDFNLTKNSSDFIIMLIPGYLTVFQSWQRVMELLTKKYRVLYFESREKSSSNIPNRKMERQVTLHKMAYDLKEVVEQMELDKQKYITLASSTGGNILTEALSENWINPTGAVMVGPAIEFHVNWFIVFLSAITPNALIQGILKPFVKIYISIVYVNKNAEPEQLQKYMRALEEAHMRKAMPLFRRMYHYKSWHMLPKVKTPTLLLGASLDKMHATKECLHVHELMPNSFYVDLGSNKATHSDPLVEEIGKFENQLNGRN